MDAGGRQRRRVPRLWAALAVTIAALAVAGTWLFLRRGPAPANADLLVAQAHTVSTSAPAGKVLHVAAVFTVSLDVPGRSCDPNPPRTEKTEEWVTNGQRHQLVRQTISSQSSGGAGTILVVVDEDAIWQSSPSSSQVIKNAYDSRLVPSVRISMPGLLPAEYPDAQHITTRLAGQGRLDGRPVTEVTLTSPVPPVYPPGAPITTAACGCNTHISPGDRTDTLVAHQWIDSRTHEVLRQQLTITDPTGQVAHKEEWRVTVDEPEDAGKVPAGFFTFAPPPGANVLTIPAHSEGHAMAGAC